ncbi:hypothetical protein EMIHUDRAFT_239456 [Emiliania huxleyi CCMP1516]|uniref:PIPK domain-containing protein n=2 Tax=Emiliania huxleyi TaxID=2903 RepID=A0A0D3JJ71_EMIH1|nr:hypothetical protein EMIHUDRAFT_239456 [Emiliania huxleyi CCMP1516]EOD23556.1 hypothetical protein EMIHUDRAFT_239456 [Emiliania huxleyi CCMP1516]|eukprot:XP_005775985.1 hypothetical protein EMIHUDRAFT_239456 [Emiliania huxleyi CCMP1516]
MVGNFSEGRSGGFFFTTADRRYLVKTIGRKERRRGCSREREQRRLLKMLPRYYEFLRTNPRSLLSRFSGGHCVDGCYCLTMHGQSRRFAAAQLAGQCQKDFGDAEFLRSHNIMDYSLLVGIQHGYGSVDPLSLPPLARRLVPLPPLAARRAELRRTAKGICPLAFSADPTADPGAVYYFAIIDLLQSWDWGKRLERSSTRYFRGF